MSPVRNFTGDQDGVSLGNGAGDQIAFYNSGTVPQRSNPGQAPIYPVTGAQVVTYQQTLTPASVATITAAEQSLTVGTTAGNGLLSTDFVAAVNKPTQQAGIGVHTARISAANTMFLVFSNTTGGTLTPTASQVYNVTVLRNFPTHVQALAPVAVVANSVSEQVFNLTPVSAAGTAVVNAAGQVSGVVMTSAGSNYTVPPQIAFNYLPAGPAASGPQVNPSNPGAITLNAANTNLLPGAGASAVPIMSAGTVVGVQITNPGAGYTTAPTITFLGGNDIAPGMAVMVTKPTTNAGLAICNARVTGLNQIAIQFVNLTAATVTPTSPENYSIVGLHTLPTANQLTSYGMVATGLVSVASQTCAEQTFTVSGLLAVDIAVSANKPTASAGLGVAGSRVSAANTLAINFVNPTGAAITPSATEVYFVNILNQVPIVPFSVLTSRLSPTSVAANQTAEQTFSVTGLPFVNSSPGTVFVNKPSFQPGLAIAGCRISAANTLAITFENVTGSAIIPNSEIYTIGVFNAVGPGGGVPGSWVALTVQSHRITDLLNEVQQTLGEAGLGAFKGA
jgi:hypothetical protein